MWELNTGVLSFQWIFFFFFFNHLLSYWPTTWVHMSLGLSSETCINFIFLRCGPILICFFLRIWEIYKSRAPNPITRLPSCLAIYSPPTEIKSQNIISFHPWELQHSQYPLICRTLFWHPVFHLGLGFLLGGGLCLLLSRHHLSWPSLLSSDLVNGLVALMNSNVSSPVNLVSMPSPFALSRTGHRLILLGNHEKHQALLFLLSHT